MNVEERQSARQGLAIYFAVLLAGSAFLEWKILRTGESTRKIQLLILTMMYIPAVASVAARLTLREGFADVSFRLGGREGLRSIPTFALGGHFLSARQRIPFAFNVGTAKIGENSLGEDLASFLRDPSLACCC